MNRRVSCLTRVTVAACSLLFVTHARARSVGIAADGCDGCHGGGKAPTMSIDVTPAAPGPGETVTVTVNIPAVNGNVAGVYLQSNGKGALATIAGESTRLIDGNQLVHSAPKAASGGVVRFSARWTAPSTPGGVMLTAWGLAANGDRTSKGDGAGAASKGLAVGCAGKTYYRDFDGDGFGGAESVVDCSKPTGYADNNTDCDDNDKNAFPGAPELCNGRDDNCDGRVDENLEERTQYEDLDGDGYGKSSGKTIVAKCPPPGFAPVYGDCDDNDKTVNPGQKEICNHRDDNCDGRVDERVRPVCGVGMCARAAPTCDESTCIPGEPRPETCNGLDDDCDGEVDEGSLCPAGQVCHDADCVPADSVAVTPDAGATPDAPKSAGDDAGGCAYGGSPSASLAAIVTLLALTARARRRR